MKQKNEQFANLTVNHFTTVVGKKYTEFLSFNINLTMRETPKTQFDLDLECKIIFLANFH